MIPCYVYDVIWTFYVVLILQLKKKEWEQILFSLVVDTKGKYKSKVYIFRSTNISLQTKIHRVSNPRGLEPPPIRVVIDSNLRPLDLNPLGWSIWNLKNLSYGKFKLLFYITVILKVLWLSYSVDRLSTFFY